MGPRGPNLCIWGLSKNYPRKNAHVRNVRQNFGTRTAIYRNCRILWAFLNITAANVDVKEDVYAVYWTLQELGENVVHVVFFLFLKYT